MDTKTNFGSPGTPKWKQVVVNGLPGIVIGAAGIAYANTVAANSNEGPSDELTNDTNDAASGTAQMATGVTDNMSFAEAFETARAEVGAGGAFEWHGNIYSTYTSQEWASMDDATRNEYAESIQWDGPTHDYASQSHHHQATHAQPHHAAPHHEAANPDKLHDTPQDEEDDDDVEVEIIGVEHQNIDGEHDSLVGTANVNGQTVFYIDIDGQDDEFECLAIDTNQNHQLDETDQAVDISSQHLSVSEFQQLAQAQHQASPQQEEPVSNYYAENEDLPDYVNDADPGSLG